MKKLLTLMLSLSLFTANAAIKQSSHGAKSINADIHEVIDIGFKSRTIGENPFATQFNVTLTSPSGAEQLIHGFYNGDKEWVLRFSSSEAGVWSYTTQSDNKSLNNKKGKITINNNTYQDRKGAIIANENDPQHLYWEDGSPYFMLGFECDFLFALDYHNGETTPMLDKFADGIAENGFNHVVMNVYANDVVWGKDKKLANFPEYEFGGDETIFPFLGSNSKPDFSSLNVDFFKHLDRTMESLNERDIISHLMIYVWNKNVRWPEMYSEADNLYFDYVVKRYQAFTNLVWDISKEALYYGRADDEYILERIDRLRKMDSFERLVTVHDYGFCNRHSDQLDIISRQDWKLNIYGEMLKSSQLIKDKPIYNIEHGGYEESDFFVFCGNYINAEECLRRNYECLFGGSYTTYYWQGCSWNVIVYDWEDGSNVEYRPKMRYFKYMNDFFHKYPYSDFRPEPNYNNSGFTMVNKKGDTFLIYRPMNSYKVSLNALSQKVKAVSVEWFNTTTGEYSETKEYNNIGAIPAHLYHGESDAIMVLKVLEWK